MRVESEATHKRRILAGIRTMERRRETETFKGRKPRAKRRPRYKYATMLYLPWEMGDAPQ